MDDDLEEMRALRDARGGKSACPYDDIKPDSTKTAQKPDKVEKKARTFDLMAMFSEARQTAITRKPLNCDDEPVNEVCDPPEDEQESQEQDEMAKVMGFGSFGTIKKSKALPAFDVSALKTEAKKVEEKNEKNKTRNYTVSAAPESEDDLIGPPIPQGFQPATTSRVERDSDDETTDSENDDDDDPVNKIPSSSQICLNHGNKAISALALDPAGARLITGGYDYDVKLWDFAGMDSSLQSFRQLRPCECHIIKSVEYSNTGDHILIVAGNATPKVLDRDGFEKFECHKGDMYVRDQKHTKGHTGMCHSGLWNPKIREQFITCAIDGTVRLWDLKGEGKTQKALIRFKDKQGRRTIPTCCTYSPDGRWIAAGCQDGSIQIYDHSKMPGGEFVNVAFKNMTAHQFGTDTSCLKFSYDGRTLASRGGDDTLKTWDMRNFKQPLNQVNGLFNKYAMTDCCWSPDDRLLVTGVSLDKGETEGKLMFYERETLKKVEELVVSDSSVVRCLWHPRLNQMAVGTANGQVKMLYDPNKSNRGAKMAIIRTGKKKQHSEVCVGDRIITPHALPIFREQRETSTRKKEEKARKDPVKSHRPDLPVTGPKGVGGRLGNKGGTLSQYVSQLIVKRKPDLRDKDPRAAILRHAEESKKNPMWVAPAYEKTQPHAVFMDVREEQKQHQKEDEDDDVPLWKKQKIA